MASRMQQPMFILSEGSQRTRGQAAQDSNIRAGKAVANAVRTTLGPRGMDKMLVDSSGTSSSRTTARRFSTRWTSSIPPHR